MSGESFRFIHASDFRLEAPLGDLDALPPALSTAIADAPRRSARAALEAAEAENIDFLVLSGDLLAPATAGPHAMALLIDAFEKLHQKQTPVYWVAGLSDDPARWPDAVPLPPNVTLFPKNRTLDVPVERAGRTICRIVGRSSDGRSTLHAPSFQVDPADEFTIGVGYGSADPAALAETRFDYWALGGRPNRRTLENAASGGAAYCGSPQGRGLSEDGPHGYSVVDVDADGSVRTHAVECDTFRYQSVQVEASEIVAVGSLKNLIGEKIVRAQHDAGGRHLLIGWDIRVTDPADLAAVGDATTLLAWARREYGHGSPAAWTASLSVDSPTQFPAAWRDEDTILGDFLRAAAKRRGADAGELNLLPLTEEEETALPATVTAMVAEVSASQRDAVLADATRLGVSLLRGGNL